MDDLILIWMQDMNPEQRQLFMSQYTVEKKSFAPAFLWGLFAGGIGAHHYYLGNMIWGVIYTLFCWTFIPGLFALVELCFTSYRVKRYNEKLAEELATRVKILTNPQQSPSIQTSHILTAN